MHRIVLVILSTFISTVVFSQKTEVGYASYYADKFNGKPTASGVVFDQKKLTAAHRTLPFGSKIKVTNVKNNRSVIVKVIDRGPFVKGRIVDLSKTAALKLNFIKEGIAKVKIEVLYVP